MGASRLCVFLAVLVSAKMVAAQPNIFSQLFCDLMCDDDDDYDSDESWIFGIDCSDCSDSKPSKSKTTTPAPKGTQQPINLMIPPSSGMNVTLINTGSSWWMNLMPWLAGPAAANTPAATTAAPATTAAGTTAAGGSTAEPTTTAKA